MIKVMIHGYNGNMGKTVARLLENDTDCVVVSGVSNVPDTDNTPFETYCNIFNCNDKVDVIIDFSTATAVPNLLEYAVSKKIPVVLCTTGLSDETLKLVDEASKEIAVFKSANMSLGINLINSIIKKYSEVLYNNNFDIEIIEKHHNKKIDAPSGTALLLADTIRDSLDDNIKYVNDRSQTNEKRTKSEIGIHAVRGGTIVGEHSVIYAGLDEVVEIKHQATSKEVFAVGAVKACKFVANKPAGLYNMTDIMESL